MKKIFKKGLEKIQSLTTVLVAGQLEFIGFHLCQALLSRGCLVYALDELNRQKREALSLLKLKKNFHFLRFDPRKPFKNLNSLEFDYLFHLGAEKESFWKKGDFAQFAHQQKAKFLLLVKFEPGKIGQRAEKRTIKYFSRLDLDARIVRFVEAYGPRMTLKKKSEIGWLFANWQAKTTFKLSGDGSRILRPIFIEDLINGLLKAMFGRDSKGKVYSLAGPKTPILKFTNALRRQSKSTLGIEFGRPAGKRSKEPQEKEILQSQKELNWQPGTSLAEGINQTLDWLNRAPMIPQGNSFLGFFLKKKNKKIFRRTFLALAGFLAGLSLFLGSLAFYYSDQVGKMRQLRDSLAAGELERAGEQLPAVLHGSRRAKKALLNFSPVFSFFRLERQADRFLTIFDLGVNLAKTVGLTAQTAEAVDRFTEIVIEGRAGDLNQQREELSFYLNQLWDLLSEIETSNANKEVAAFQRQLPFDREEIGLGRELLEILPDLLAFDGKKTYLILIQNNLELRPTGGYLGSYGLLIFEKGKLLDFQIQDSSLADSQLEGKVEMPSPLKKYLGGESWFFRDANWNPHFPDSARQAEWFLKREVGREVQGTIALNLDFIQRLLEIFGPVELEKRQLISADNVLERVEFYSSKEEELSGDLAGRLLRAVFEKVEGTEGRDWLRLAKALEKGLARKEILASLQSVEAADFFDRRGWNGAIRGVTGREDMLADYLMLVEANLSIRRLNYFVEREVVQEATILADGRMEAKTQLKYFNRSDGQAPGGLYRNYLRVYLPLQSQLKSIKLVDNQGEEQILSGPGVDVFEEQAKLGLGFLIEIPPEEEKRVEIIYRLAEKIDFDQTGSYAFYFQKQPGIGEDPFIFKINYPANLAVQETFPQADFSSQQVIFETDTGQDRFFLLELEKKE